MPKNSHVDLAAIDGQLLDGLEYCRKVYDLFDQIRRGANGTSRLRLRPAKTEKRLVEELLPLARYILARYQAGRRIKVRWLSGSQPYDAVLWSYGLLVEHGDAPRRILVEVTTSAHQNDYWARQYFDEHGMSFGVKGISKDQKTGKIVSRPYVFGNDELIRDLSGQILDCLRKKSAKHYPSGTVLIINCFANSPMLEEEWNDAVDRVRQAQAHLSFRKVFLLKMVGSHSTTLYGHVKRSGRRASRS